jgi:hypothetical protein
MAVATAAELDGVADSHGEGAQAEQSVSDLGVPDELTLLSAIARKDSEIMKLERQMAQLREALDKAESKERTHNSEMHMLITELAAWKQKAVPP